ncbi:MAG: aminotransferase class I/II-fold pyridoxal phosphate-dependent enzyme, partial [Nitrospirota bacterium]
FAGGKVHEMPLLKKNNFLPDLKAIPLSILKKAKLMFVNYPNNPTSATAGRDFYQDLIRFAVRNNIIVCHDAAYSEVYYDNQKPLSFLQIPGAKNAGIEFHSLSKTYNMTGWRIGFAVGNAEVLAGLGKIKSNLDSGIFQAVQEAGIEALKTGDLILKKIRNTYQARRDILYSGLKDIGLEIKKPKASFYLWAEVPEGYNSTEFVRLLLDKAGVLSTPGVGFGRYGEGYIRFALTVSAKKIEEAVERIKKVL